MTRSEEMVDLLVRGGAMTRHAIQFRMGLNERGFRRTMKLARRRAFADGKTIPRPVYRDGYLYRVTDVWVDPTDEPAIRAGSVEDLKDDIARNKTIKRNLMVAKAAATDPAEIVALTAAISAQDVAIAALEHLALTI